ncbi:hypothetical protein GVAV_001821 [Gurleya vavrai]
MKSFYLIVLLKITYCFERIEDTINKVIKFHDEHKMDIGKDYNYENCVVFLLQYKRNKISFKNPRELIDFYKDLLKWDNELELFYFQSIRKRGQIINTANYCNEDDSNKNIFNDVFSNDDLHSFGKRINNIDLSDELHTFYDHIFFYSNFNSKKYAPNLVGYIGYLLKNEFKKDSVSVFILKDEKLKNKIEVLETIYNHEEHVIDRCFTINQIEFDNSNICFKIEEPFILENKNYYGFERTEPPKISKKTFSLESFEKSIILKETINFHKGKKDSRIKYGFGELTFEIRDYEIDTKFKDTLKINFTDLEIKKNLTIVIQQRKPYLIFKFNFFLISGKFEPHVLDKKSNLKEDYIILFADTSRDYYNTVCFLNTKYQFINFKKGQIFPFDFLDNFLNRIVQYFEKNYYRFELFIEDYFPYQFFLINHFNYPKLGIIQKISINNFIDDLHDIYKIFYDFKEFNSINVSEFFYQIPESKYEFNKQFFVNVLINTYKTKNLENINEDLYYNKNFLLELKYDDNYIFYIYVLKKIFFKGKDMFDLRRAGKLNIEIYLNPESTSDNEKLEMILIDFKIILYYAPNEILTRETVWCIKGINKLQNNSNKSKFDLKTIIEIYDNYYNNKKEVNQKQDINTIMESEIQKFYLNDFDEKYKNNYSFTSNHDELKKNITVFFIKIFTKIYELANRNLKENFCLELFCFDSLNCNLDSKLLIYFFLKEKYKDKCKLDEINFEDL